MNNNKQEFIKSLVKRAKMAQMYAHASRRLSNPDHMRACQSARNAYIDSARLAKVWL